MTNKLLKTIKQVDNDFYLIGETAYNHEGNINYLYKMINGIASVGWDAVKFHLLLKPESYMTEGHPLFQKVKGWIYNEKQWEDIIRYSNKKGLEIIALCDDVGSIEFILEKKLPVSGIELHASCLNDYFMLQKLWGYHGVIILGIGGSSIEEIEYAVKTLRKNGKGGILLMYGFQNFPTDYKEINLRRMCSIRDLFSLPVGYADHTAYDNENNEFLSSIGFVLGARVLEKHYTPDYGVERTDFQSACNNEQLKAIKEKLIVLKDALGDGSFQMSNAEEAYGKTGPMKKAIVAKRGIPQGKKIEFEDLWFKRTKGESSIKQKDIEGIVGLKVEKGMDKDEIIDPKKLKVKKEDKVRNIGFLIIARLKSTRLPYKILLDLNGKSVIERIIDRAKNVDGIDKIVLCTSTNEQDEPLVNVAKRAGIECFLGSEDDVLTRFLGACEHFGLDGFVGITADNPLFSVRYSNLLVEIAKKEDPDYILIENLPLGTATYYIKKKALQTICRVKKVVNTEIWGPLVNRPDVFDIKTIKAAPSLNKDYRLTLDMPVDYETINGIYNKVPFNDYLRLDKVIDFLEKNPSITKNADITQKYLSNEEVKRIDNFYRANKDKILRVKNEIYSE